MSIETELTVELIAVLDTFKSAHAELVAQLERDRAYPLWLQAEPDPIKARDLLISLILNWSYTSDDLEPGKTLQYNGLAPCSEATLRAVDTVNHSRAALRQQLIKMDRINLGRGVAKKEDEEDNPEDLDGADNRLSKKILRRLGYPRFNRRQACRQFVALPETVLSAGFFWNRYRKTVKLNRQQIQKKLDRLAQHSTVSEAAILAEYRRFDAIPDEFLVQIYPESFHQRVNLFVQKDNKERRIQHYAHSPIFYLAAPDWPLPDKTLLPEHPAEKGTRLTRRNITTEREPYLYLLNMHRLLPQYR